MDKLRTEEMINQYHRVRIAEIVTHSDYLKTFKFDKGFRSKPGQFGMVWIPGVDEKPISFNTSYRMTIKKVGPFTEKLFDMKEGDYMRVKGPYGNGFPSGLPHVAIGGGCGLAPLSHLIASSEHPIEKFIMAGRTESDLFCYQETLNLVNDNWDTLKPKNLIPVTEDGSLGIKGIVTDALDPSDIRKDLAYFICGPEPMMAITANVLKKIGVKPENIYLSMESYMKCAVGLCGNCEVSGYRVCADGPVFQYSKIRELPHFNSKKRSRTGELVDL